MTCDFCFDLRHYKCKGGCGCSVCSGAVKPLTTEAIVRDSTDVGRRRSTTRRKKPHTSVAKELLSDPVAVARREYMRDYRNRIKSGEPIRVYRRVEDAEMAQAVEEVRAGSSWRAAATRIGVDQRALSKQMKHAGYLNKDGSILQTEEVNDGDTTNR